MLFDDWTATYCMMVCAVNAELPSQGKRLFKSFLSECGEAVTLGLIILEAY